jgi:hypothetical protein
LGHNSGANQLVISAVQNERFQAHETRQSQFVALEAEIGRPVVTLFTSFRYPVSINDDDLSILEGLLQTLNTENGIAIMINSPGGSGLAAERIINLFRAYSGTDEYWAIVPGQAKSAATMVCLGASKIIMGPASELGPIDPQIVVREQFVSVHHVIDSYHKLFRGAQRAKGNLEPYLQQLQKYDASEISHLENQRDLATDIAISCLRSGMMRTLSDQAIKEKIKVFLLPTHTKTHGRPIYFGEARQCGLNIDVLDADSKSWRIMYELYIRTSNYVSHNAAKAVETAHGSFYMQAPDQEGS